MACPRSVMKKKVVKPRTVKRLVFMGKRTSTSGGLVKEQLVKNKRGKIVSRSLHEIGKKRYSNIQPWSDAVALARKQLNVVGFVAINGPTVMGKRIYIRAKMLLQQSHHGGAVAPTGASPVKEEKAKEEPNLHH